MAGHKDAETTPKYAKPAIYRNFVIITAIQATPATAAGPLALPQTAGKGGPRQLGVLLN
jgi:hypothetical protein